MKNLILILLITFTLVSCSADRPIKIISTGERAYVTDWDNIYKTGDTIIVYQRYNSINWKIDIDWLTKKDTTIYTITYRVAVITKN